MIPGTTTSPVSAGPFEREPVGLGRRLSENFSDAVSGEEIRRRCVGWLSDRLDDAGVALGAADREIVDVLAGEGWSVTQVVAGWVTRAGATATDAAGGFGCEALSSIELPRSRTGGAPASSSGSRPLALRRAHTAPSPELPDHRYDVVQQVAVGPDGRPLAPSMAKDWTSLAGTHTDGDGGDNETWDWEEVS